MRSCYVMSRKNWIKPDKYICVFLSISINQFNFTSMYYIFFIIIYTYKTRIINNATIDEIQIVHISVFIN